MDKRKIVDCFAQHVMRILGKDTKSRNYLMKSFCMAAESGSDYFTTYKLREKKADKITVLSTFSEIHQKVGIVIQGPIREEDDFTIETVLLYKKFYTDCPIVVSTWKDTNEDTVKKLQDAGAVVLQNERPSKTGLGNMNFQVISSMSGIEYLENQNCEYILKTRSDQRICKPHFLEFFLCLLKQFPAQNNNGMKRLVVTQGMVGGVMLKPFMITDFLYFGETAVVKAIFDKAYSDVNMSVKERNEWIDSLTGKMPLKEFYRETAPELQLIYNAYRFYYNREPELSVKDYWNFVKEQLITVGWDDIDLYWPKYAMYNESAMHNSIGSDDYSIYNWNLSNWLLLYSGMCKYKEEYEQFSE